MDICYFCENEAERHLCWCVVSWRDRVSACFPHSDQHASCTNSPSEVPLQKVCLLCNTYAHMMYAYICVHTYEQNATNIHKHTCTVLKSMCTLTQIHTNIFPHMHTRKPLHELSQIQSCCAEKNVHKYKHRRTDRLDQPIAINRILRKNLFLNLVTFADG